MADYIVSDTSLTAVADAIREKTGKSGQMAFPNGFVSEVEGIEKGATANEVFYRTAFDGEDIVLDDTGDLVKRDLDYAFAKMPVKSVLLNLATQPTRAWYTFSGCTKLQSLSIPYLTALGNQEHFAEGCSALTNFHAPLLEAAGATMLNNCDALETLVFPSMKSVYTSAFAASSKLRAVDFGGEMSGGLFRNSIFNGDGVLTTLVIRKTDGPCAITNVNVFSGTTFRTGDTGGTIYIHKVLYDELGTGSTNDYKAATNWSTVDAYGTITWAQIEGSEYENYYVDGTPIVEPTYYDMSTVTWSASGNDARSSGIPTGDNGILLKISNSVQIYNADTNTRITGPGVYVTQMVIIPSMAANISIAAIGHKNDIETWLADTTISVRIL